MFNVPSQFLFDGRVLLITFWCFRRCELISFNDLLLIYPKSLSNLDSFEHFFFKLFLSFFGKLSRNGKLHDATKMSNTQAWKALQQHYETVGKSLDMNELFTNDPERFDKFNATFGSIFSLFWMFYYFSLFINSLFDRDYFFS